MTTRTRRRPIPAHWQLFFDQKGIRSSNHLAQITNLPSMTINRMVYGDARTGPDILRAVAEKLGVEERVIYGLAGWPQTTKPWVPPAEAEAMTDRQRKAVTELIRAFVRPALEEAEDRAPADAHALAANQGAPTEGQVTAHFFDGLGEDSQDTTSA